jgi:D-sedoheptulose 7-phosphate isomerase
MSARDAVVRESALAQREVVLTRFLEREQDGLARACHAMARRFARGGTLIAHGAGAAASDAAHVAVEFMHPVIVGKRALGALATTGTAFAGGPDDIALALVHGTRDADAQGEAFLAAARGRGALTLALTGPDGGPAAEFAWAVPSADPAVVQEVHETAYHVLWELVHVFFEHPGLLEEPCLTCGDVAVEARVTAVHGDTATVEHGGRREDVAVDLIGPTAVGDVLLCHAGVAIERVPEPDPTAFLYPFLEAEESDLEAVLADVRASTLRKGADTIALRREIDLQAVDACAAAVRARLGRGGRLLSFGNGGSATDAQDVAIDALALGWPAIALTDDVATITAVGNDVGFDNVFARQLIALGRTTDTALGFSTSGSSPNVVAALEESHRRGMLTCAIAGYDGGRLAGLPWLDHLFVVHGDYVPRLQEAHATIYHLLLDSIGPRP